MRRKKVWAAHFLEQSAHFNSKIAWNIYNSTYLQESEAILLHEKFAEKMYVMQ